jgi:hypothetical protein
MPLSGLLLSGVMLALFAGMTGIALSYPPDARLLPLVIGIPGTLLCASQLVLDLRRHRRQRATPGRHAAGATRRELAFLGWLAAFVIGVLLLGFPYGAPALVFVFLYWGQGERLASAGAAAVGLLLFLHIVFARALGLPLFEGLLIEKLPVS